MTRFKSDGENGEREEGTAGVEKGVEDAAERGQGAIIGYPQEGYITAAVFSV
jgi:hypothetical protein